MTKATTIEPIEKATKIKWDEWLNFFKKIGAEKLSHKEIAQKVYEKLDGKIESAGWWSQNVTVAYEQEIGRREPGQRSDGTYEVSVSKTFNGTMDQAFEAWIELTQRHTDFNGVKLAKESTKSKTEKWCNWHCSLQDGTRVTIGIYQKSPDKAGLGLAHQKLRSKDEAERWREFWKAILQKLPSK